MVRIVIIVALLATLALPFALRPDATAEAAAAAARGGPVETLVIITPHNEAIRHEYGLAFTRWYRAQTGREVRIDWRVIGGTSEIARFLESEYVASFQLHWTKQLGRPWSTVVQGAFANGRLPATASPEAQEARAAFLASDVGCGIDLFFGGGTFDFIRQAQAGRIVDSGILQRRPEWFTPEVIPQSFAGEEYWDREGRWVGTVLSSYGIIYDRDALARLGITTIPDRWEDLADPRLIGEVALCDPTKSGSIAKAFENVIQQQMQRRLVALTRAAPAGLDAAAAQALETQAVDTGWLAGLRLLQLVGANARYFTDSSQKPSIDVAAGNCAVGMSIDYFARQQVEVSARRSGTDRVGYVSPPGGAVSSVDPIALLRGAKQRAIAEQFIEFTLSMEGQKLWNYRPGTVDGPAHFALRRLPVRRDFYTLPGARELRSDPDANPYIEEDRLIYRDAWTGRVFREMAFIVRVMCLDTHGELTRAWQRVIAAGRPPEALSALQDLAGVELAATQSAIKAELASPNKVREVTLAKDFGAQFRRRYAVAAELAVGEPTTSPP